MDACSPSSASASWRLRPLGGFLEASAFLDACSPSRAHHLRPLGGFGFGLRPMDVQTVGFHHLVILLGATNPSHAWHTVERTRRAHLFSPSVCSQAASALFCFGSPKNFSGGGNGKLRRPVRRGLRRVDARRPVRRRGIPRYPKLGDRQIKLGSNRAGGAFPQYPVRHLQINNNSQMRARKTSAA